MKTRIVIVDVGYTSHTNVPEHSIWAIPFECLNEAKEYARKIKQYWENKQLNPGEHCMPITYVDVRLQPCNEDKINEQRNCRPSEEGEFMNKQLQKIIKKIDFDPRTKIQHIGNILTDSEQAIVKSCWSKLIKQTLKK